MSKTLSYTLQDLFDQFDLGTDPKGQIIDEIGCEEALKLAHVLIAQAKKRGYK